MEIIDQCHEGLDVAIPWTTPTYDVKRGLGEREATIQAEHALDVIVNEVPTMRVVCSPDHLIELTLGRLLTEGIIGGVQDVEELYLCEHGSRARVFLRDKRADFSRARPLTVPSCCTGNVTYNSYFADGQRPAPVKPLAWEAAWIIELARQFRCNSPLHASTGGAHSCRLRLASGDVLCCEDLGRHNALDKVVGWALRAGEDLRKCVLFSSGRIPEDMALKTVRAGVPVLVSKSVPTDAAVHLAREFDLTLICNARPDGFDIFNDPDAPDFAPL